MLNVSDRVQDGMRELDVLKEKRDVNLCSVMALMLAHKKAHSIGACVKHLLCCIRF